MARILDDSLIMIRIYEGGYHEEIDGRMMAFCCVHCAAAYKSESRHHH
ncbi:MAG: hypothetical protein ACTSVD_03475 [Candidatus Thorarchaeota archaeon]